jgi:hypothetical protein
MERERRTDKTWCHQKYMYEEWKEHKNVYIDSIRKLANKKLSLSHSSCIHIKNILKTQDKTATIAIAAFIHVYIYTYTHNFNVSVLRTWCPPTWVRKSSIELKRNEKVSKSIEEIGEEI